MTRIEQLGRVLAIVGSIAMLELVIVVLAALWWLP